MVNHQGRSSKKAAARRLAAKAAKPRKTVPKSQSRKVAKPALLAGGNPQIAKADGDAPVPATIAAMPGWKRDLGAASTRSSCAPSLARFQGKCEAVSRPESALEF